MQMDTASENDVVVSLTESAAQQVKVLLADEKENAGKTLRVFVEGGGCSGMQYGMVFDEKRDDDFSGQFYGVSVLVDPFSANYLRGSVVGFKNELNGGGVKNTQPQGPPKLRCRQAFQGLTGK